MAEYTTPQVYCPMTVRLLPGLIRMSGCEIRVNPTHPIIHIRTIQGCTKYYTCFLLFVFQSISYNFIKNGSSFSMSGWYSKIVEWLIDRRLIMGSGIHCEHLLFLLARTLITDDGNFFDIVLV